jgi:hypothetical protein
MSTGGKPGAAYRFRVVGKNVSIADPEKIVVSWATVDSVDNKYAATGTITVPKEEASYYEFGIDYVDTILPDVGGRSMGGSKRKS